MPLVLRLLMKFVRRVSKRSVFMGRVLMIGSIIAWFRRRGAGSAARVRLRPNETMTVTVRRVKGPEQ